MFLFNWDFYSIYSIIHIYKRIFYFNLSKFLYLCIYENKKGLLKEIKKNN